MGRAEAVRLHEALLEQFIASFARPPRRLVLDFDATDDPVHGMQEGRFFHGYYDRYCFLPLYVFCGDRLLAALPASMAYRPRESRGIMIKIGGESDSGRQAQRWRQTHGSMSVNQSEQIRQAWSSGSSSSCSRSRSCQRLLLSTVLAITPSSSRRFLALATRSSRVPAWFQV